MSTIDDASDFTDELTDEQRAAAEIDRAVYGRAYFEKTDDGYRRLDPTDVIADLEQ